MTNIARLAELEKSLRIDIERAREDGYTVMAAEWQRNADRHRKTLIAWLHEHFSYDLLQAAVDAHWQADVIARHEAEIHAEHAAHHRESTIYV